MEENKRLPETRRCLCVPGSRRHGSLYLHPEDPCQPLYKIADALPKEMDNLAKKLHLDKQRLSDMPMLMMKIYVTRL